MHAIDEDIAKAQAIIDGKRAIKKNRVLKASIKGKTLDEEKIDQLKTMAGIKAYQTSRTDLALGQVLGHYKDLLNVEAAFRMAKTDLKARPLYHRVPLSIRGHLAMVTISIAIGHVIEKTLWPVPENRDTHPSSLANRNHQHQQHPTNHHQPPRKNRPSTPNQNHPKQPLKEATRD